MSYAGSLQIGPLAFHCETASGAFAIAPTGAYISFWHVGDTHDIDPPRIVLPLKKSVGKIDLPSGVADFESGRNWKLCRREGELIFAAGYAERSRPERLCRVTSDLAHGELLVDREALAQHPIPPRIQFPLAYPLDQILAWGMLSRIQGALLHAALIVRPDGQGLLLAGRSGAGKSTLAALCADAGWTVLNDDRALVHFEDGRVLASGTPWHGSGKYAEPRTVPLAGMYFLAQSPTNHVQDISRSEVLAELLRVASLPVFLDDWCTPTLATLDKLTRAIPLRRLHFRRDPSAVDALSG